MGGSQAKKLITITANSFMSLLGKALFTIN